jgi:hypothetical protein
MKNNNNKNLIYILTGVIILLLIIIFLFLTKPDNMFDFFSSINYHALTTVVTIIALIYTIHDDRMEKNETIESFIEVSNQIEFEKTLYDCISSYDKLLEDFSCTNFDFASSVKDYISYDSITKFQNISYSYSFIFKSMTDKMRFFYKKNDSKRPCFDKLVKDIDALNTTLIEELKQCNDIVILAYEVNKEALGKDKEKLTEMVTTLNKNRAQIYFDIASNINKHKQTLYKAAQDCIDERARFE